MDHFSIRDIENLSGIRAHTIRAWEQRYGLRLGRRGDGMQRVYSDEDLKQLLRIAFLYHSGHKISVLARLGQEEICRMVENSLITEDNYGAFVQQLIAAGIELDKEKFEKIVNTLVMRIGFEKSLTAVFFPFLERIGLLWMTNHMIPAQEHFTSHIIRKKLILATDGIDVSPTCPAKLLVFAPVGERHEIPLLAANYFFRKHGLRTCYVGVNTSDNCLQDYLETWRPDFVFTHVITSLAGGGLVACLEAFTRKYPGMTWLISGPACRQISPLPATVKMLHSLEELLAFADAVPALISASHNSSHPRP